MADRMHQMRLALSGAAVQEQRAEPGRAGLRQRLRGIERDSVRRLDHESFEGEPWIEHRRRRPDGRCPGLEHGDFCGRLGLDYRRCRALAPRFDDDGANLWQQRSEFLKQPLGIVALHPIGHEGRRQGESNDIGIAGFDQHHRLEPLIEQASAGRVAQMRPNASPGGSDVARPIRQCLASRHARSLSVTGRDNPLRSPEFDRHSFPAAENYVRLAPVAVL